MVVYLYLFIFCTTFVIDEYSVTCAYVLIDVFTKDKALPAYHKTPLGLTHM